MGGLEYKTMPSGTARFSGPCGLVEMTYDALVVVGAHRSGQIDKDEFEQLLADGVGDVPYVRPVAGSMKPIT